jgi:hypothetical protein
MGSLVELVALSSVSTTHAEIATTSKSVVNADVMDM